MSQVKRGKLIVIVAPSGAGKSTLIKRLNVRFKNLAESVSYTTRPIRPGEKHGVNYFYISKEEFVTLRDKEEFLEWAVVHSNFYGTSKKFVNQKLSEGQDLLFDLDVQGADAFRKYFKDEAKIIFIDPGSIDILKERLLKRGTESTEIIEERIKNAKKELLRKNDYDFCVLNDDLEVAYVNIEKIFAMILED